MLAALAAVALAADWPDFLPQTRLHPAVGDPPVTWSPEQNIAWKSDLPGDGQSSPVVLDGKVTVTGVEGEMKDRNLITCLELATGSVIWQRDFETALKVKSSLYVSRAAPTAVADAAGVVAAFESSDVIALDWDGNVRWQRALTSDYGPIKAEFGLAASLAQIGELVFVLIENEGPSYLVALDKSTGDTVWKADRPSVISWSSPAAMTLADVPQVVVSSVGTVESYDAASGQKIWSIGGLGGNTVASPSQVDARRLLIGAAPGRGESDAGPFAQSNLMIEVAPGQPDGDGSRDDAADAGAARLDARVLWRTQRARASFSSPLAYQGVGYWVNRAGIVFGIDLSDGKELFAQRIDQAPWATAIGVADRVYFFGKDGVTTVIRSGKEFERIATNQLFDPDEQPADSDAAQGEETAERRAAAAMFSGPIQYGVALADDSFVIRSGNRLYRIAEDADR